MSMVVLPFFKPLSPWFRQTSLPAFDVLSMGHSSGFSGKSPMGYPAPRFGLRGSMDDSCLNSRSAWLVPSGKHTRNYGKSPL